MSEMEKPKYDEGLHAELLEVGTKIEKKMTHQLPKPFVGTILGTLEFFGASSAQLAQAKMDLTFAKFKIWDMLGIWYTGGLVHAKGEVFDCIEKMVKLYILQKHVGGWAWWLRGHDLQIEEPSECQDCKDSYDSWLKEILEEGKNPDDYD